MTDREKASEIARDILYFNDYGRYSYTLSDVERICLDMAQWKQNQMIEKAVEWIKGNSKCDYLIGTYPEFLEDFKKEMMEE